SKDMAENVMIVDLLRNDITRIAQSGTIDVPELFSIEKYDTVFQMTSTVCGRLQDDIQLIDMMRALFPCGSITGAPKINTMQY
ncbi:chorismate-binding protein, partial [Staphylococcus hominis]